MIRIGRSALAVGVLGMALLQGHASAQGGWPPDRLGIGGGSGGSDAVLYPAQKPEQATQDQIVALVAKLGPGVYHRMSGCIPPPAWGSGSPADEIAAKLVRIGAPAVPHLMRRATERDEATRALVIEILARIKSDRVIPVLIDACLHDGSKRVRVSAAEGLDWSNDKRTAPALVIALKDPDRQVQLFAVRTLAKSPQPEAIDRLVELIGHAAESYPSIAPVITPAFVAESAGYALGAIGTRAYPAIITLLESQNPAVARVAKTALCRCLDRRAIPRLIGLCDDPEDMIRLEAAHALGQWSDPPIVRTLVRLMRTGGGNAAGIAAQSLARIGGNALDPLFEAAKGKDPNMREMASNSFLDIRDRSAATRLVNVLKVDDPRVREMALFTLSGWTDARALPQILAMTADPDMERRRLAIGMLCHYDDTKHPEVVQPLLKAMEDVHEWVRNQAAGALFGKRDKRIGPAMKRLESSTIPGVPELARMVLKQYRPSSKHG
ncbi:MAG: HEAT repeat domain-containing protein [Fimbriimonas sp.]|nr:HEAT repeat domain-containing protein [Fimbriimonas sp.]